MAMANIKEMQYMSSTHHHHHPHHPHHHHHHHHIPSSDSGVAILDNSQTFHSQIDDHQSTFTKSNDDQQQTNENTSNETHSSSVTFLEENTSGRGCRTKRKQTNPLFCPVCSITVRPSELEAHYLSELSKLDKLSSNGKRKSTCTTISSIMSTSPGLTGGGGASLSTPTQVVTQTDTSQTCEIIAPEKCWETYQNVKANRQGRLKLKSRKRKNDEAATCPVCNNLITGEINQHVEDCLRKNDDGGDSGDDDGDVDEDIDVGGDDFGEYEWAGQHRVRASSMLEGGYSAAGIGTCLTRINKNMCDEEEDLIVDGDDSEKYGPPQYSERDIMLVSKGEDKDQTALRLAIIGSTVTAAAASTNNTIDAIVVQSPQSTIKNTQTTTTISLNNNNNMLRHHVNSIKLRNLDWNNATTDDDDNDNNVDLDEEETTNDDDDDDQQSNNINKNPTIEALKQRVRELEKCESNKGQYKCLICMERYRTPVISICCWHVHCELCWLKTLGIKKLCPQCNMITSPTDLRKVYI